MKQRSKKSLKLTDAVVRGAKNSYEFEVFPIQTEFEPQSAVYIFSERKVDKKGRGHQKFVCIGQTPSLDGEFSKFKKNFAAKYNANVICVYIEENENSRLKIEEELKKAYLISCSNNLKEKSVVRSPRISKPKTVEAVQPEKQISKFKKAKEEPKTVEKIVKKKAVKVKPAKPPVKAKSPKPTATKQVVKAKKQKKTVKPAKPTAKKLKAVPVKNKSRVQTPLKQENKTQKVKNSKPASKTTAKKAKANGKSNTETPKLKGKTNGKQPPASNKKPAVKSRATGNKPRASKQISRKQLAF